MVPENILESVTETLAYAEEVRTALLQFFAVAGDDPDALAELPPLLQARAYLVLSKTTTSLLSGVYQIYQLLPFVRVERLLLLVCIVIVSLARSKIYISCSSRNDMY